jgi:hypothetical protein
MKPVSAPSDASHALSEDADILAQQLDAVLEWKNESFRWLLMRESVRNRRQEESSPQKRKQPALRSRLKGNAFAA